MTAGWVTGTNRRPHCFRLWTDVSGQHSTVLGTTRSLQPLLTSHSAPRAPWGSEWILHPTSVLWLILYQKLRQNWDSENFACPDLQLTDIFFLFFWERDNLFLVLLCVIISLFFLLKPSKINFYFYLTVFWARWRYNQAKEHRRTFMEPCNIWGWRKSWVISLRFFSFFSLV